MTDLSAVAQIFGEVDCRHSSAAKLVFNAVSIGQCGGQAVGAGHLSSFSEARISALNGKLSISKALKRMTKRELDFRPAKLARNMSSPVSYADNASREMAMSSKGVAITSERAMWVLAVGLGFAAIVLPRIANLNGRMSAAFLTAEAWGSIVGIVLASLLMGLIDPTRRARWAVVIGLAPLADTMFRMARSEPGNLWPIAIVLALLLGFIPSFLGAGLSLVRNAGRAATQA